MSTKRIVIVGGGSAGWITAAYMNAAMNAGGRKVVDISLIESPDVPRIAVGEATVPTIRQIIQTLGIDEIEFMKATDATFKQGIKFVNWLDNAGEHYHHQFSRYNPDAVDHYGADWLRSDRTVPFADTVSVQPALCDRHLSPKLIGPRQPQLPVTYAYHLNALKMADYLRDFAVARGVSHHLDNVSSVERAEDGRIAAVLTESGKRHEADIFIDCTGFASLLMEKEMDVGWEDFSQYLLCDRAVILQIPYETFYPGFVRSVTQSTALSAGWVWDIPLINRRGIGYVYSSQFISDDDAERELRQYEGTHADNIASRIVPFKVGRRKKTWVSNCVAIGLSGGFLEPLESTGLYLIQLAALTLAEYFPHEGEMEQLADHYNTIMSDRFEEILNFINLHYCMTRRSDTEFWQEVSKPERMLPAVQEKLDFWKIKPPSRGDFKDQFTLFSYQNHELILFGMDYLRDHYREKYGDDLPPTEIPDFIARRLGNMSRQLPPHELWLQQSLGMPEFQGPPNLGSVWG